LRTAYEEIISALQQFLVETQAHYPQIEYEIDKVTTRKTIFTVYDGGKQIAQFKVWIGGLLASNSIAFAYGNFMDLENDNSMNESLSLDYREGELKLKPLGMGMYGADRDKVMTSREAAEYLWKMIFVMFRD
jgi:hypothetical protein